MFSEFSSCALYIQVLASFINPGGLIPKEFEASSAGFDECNEKEDSDQSSLPALLPELLTQSCLVPALSSYLRNDSGTVSLTRGFFIPLIHFKCLCLFPPVKIFPKLSVNLGSG